MFYIMLLSVVDQNIQCQFTRNVMNSELETMWSKQLWHDLKTYCSIFLEELRGIMKTVNRAGLLAQI